MTFLAERKNEEWIKIIAPFVRFFDKLKNIALFGKIAGKALTDYDWENGKKLSEKDKKGFIDYFNEELTNYTESKYK